MTHWFKVHGVMCDRACAIAYADIRVRRTSAGRPIAVADAMTAATVLAQGAIFATGNISDFVAWGITVENPRDPV